MRTSLTILVVAAAATTAAPAAANPTSEASNRCLVLGFKDATNQALCTEFELAFPEPAKLGLGRINEPVNKCLVLGFTGEALAACTQRQLRNIPASAQPPYQIHARP
jgi:hypothetical protein